MVAIAIVTFISIHIFRVPQEYVRVHSVQLLSLGYYLQAYFIFIVAKDAIIMLSQFLYGGYSGFWHAIVLHLITTPIDVIVLLCLCIWGSFIFDTAAIEDCRKDPLCYPFLIYANLVWLMGYVYVCLCCIVKPAFIAILFFWCGGITLMAEDESEGKEA